jgi:hypothetical protein
VPQRYPFLRLLPLRWGRTLASFVQQVGRSQVPVSRVLAHAVGYLLRCLLEN